MVDQMIRSAACVALVAALALGCQQRQEVGDDVEPDTLAVSGETEMAPAAEDTSMGMMEEDTAMAGMGSSAGLSVTNTMPHEMVVVAKWGTPQVESVLGPVAPNETRTFDLAAPAGESVALTAMDSGNTHSVDGTVTTDASTPATWTIQ